MKLKLLLMCLAGMLALPAMAQEDALKAFPGYVDFGDLSMFGEPNIQIAIGGSLLGLISSVTASEDPEAAALFSRLEGVRVIVFEDQQGPDGAVSLVKEVSASLSKKGWESVVTVNSNEEQVRIFMKINEDQVEGLTVMALEEDEAVFVNIIGDLNPAELGRVMENFDIDVGGVQLGN